MEITPPKGMYLQKKREKKRKKRKESIYQVKLDAESMSQQQKTTHINEGTGFELKN